MTEGDIYTTVVRFVREATGQLVILDRQGADRPSGEHLVVNLLSSWQVGEGAVVSYRRQGALPSDTVYGRFAESVAWKFEINAYGGDSTSTARTVALALRSPFGLDKLGQVVVREVGQVRRLPEELAETWEGRAVFELTVITEIARERAIDEARTFNVKPLSGGEGPGINIKVERLTNG